MDEANKFIESIDKKKLEQLPLTYRFVQSMQKARNDVNEPHISGIIDIKCYESKSVQPSGFYRPISKIIKLTNHE